IRRLRDELGGLATERGEDRHPRSIALLRARVLPLADVAGLAVLVLIDEPPELAVVGVRRAHLHRRVRIAGDLEAGDRRGRRARRRLRAVGGGLRALALAAVAAAEAQRRERRPARHRVALVGPRRSLGAIAARRRRLRLSARA